MLLDLDLSRESGELDLLLSSSRGESRKALELDMSLEEQLAGETGEVGVVEVVGSMIHGILKSGDGRDGE